MVEYNPDTKLPIDEFYGELYDEALLIEDPGERNAALAALGGMRMNDGRERTDWIAERQGSPEEDASEDELCILPDGSVASAGLLRAMRDAGQDLSNGAYANGRRA